MFLQYIIIRQWLCFWFVNIFISLIVCLIIVCELHFNNKRIVFLGLKIFVYTVNFHAIFHTTNVVSAFPLN